MRSGHLCSSHPKSCASLDVVGFVRPGATGNWAVSNCPGRAFISCMYRNNGNVRRCFLQQGVRNGAHNLAPSKFAMHVQPPHPPCRLRCQGRLVCNRADPANLPSRWHANIAWKMAGLCANSAANRVKWPWPSVLASAYAGTSLRRMGRLSGRGFTVMPPAPAAMAIRANSWRSGTRITEQRHFIDFRAIQPFSCFSGTSPVYAAEALMCSS